MTYDSYVSDSKDTLIDEGSTYTYIGKCEIGKTANTDEPIWLISRIDNSTGSRLMASNSFNKAWDDRATLFG